MNQLSNSSCFLVNEPMVVSETIENEAIILHHGTGKYYSAQGTGALIWEGIEGGLDVAGLSRRLQGACGIGADQARDAVKAFVDLLLSHDLVKDGPRMEGAAAWIAPAPVPFETPVLSVHDDLADMLLLDPIHDTSEDGWPSARANA